MNMTKQKEELGLCRDLFVSSRPEEQTISIGGIAFDNAQWTRVLSKRAAHLLWYRLTRALFPEKAQKVTSLVSTAPLSPLSLSPTVTSHVNVEHTEDNDYFMVSGTMGKSVWEIQFNILEARRLWTALDLALYPNGWETTTPTPTDGKTPENPLPEKPKRRRQTYQ